MSSGRISLTSQPDTWPCSWLISQRWSSALWWVAGSEHSLLEGRGTCGGRERGWEQNNKCGGLRRLLYAMCCRKLYLVVHCQKIIFCHECYWSIMEEISHSFFFGVNLVLQFCVVVFPTPCFQSNQSRLNPVSLVVLGMCLALVSLYSKGSDSFIQLKETCFWLCSQDSDYSRNLKMFEGCWIFFILLCSSLLLGLMKMLCVEGGNYREVKIPHAHQRWLRPEVLRAFKQLSAPCLSWIILSVTI